VSKTILIIDDDPVLVRVLEQAFENEGYRTVSACDGAQALKKLQDEHPDLIILDIQMPKIHGYTFIFELRKLDGGQNIPILILTANQGMKDVFTAEGVKEYLLKPCSPQIILGKVKQYLPH
jgi:CheY-like chemotaxis protein